MVIIGLTILFLAIIAFQVPPLIKKQMWRDLAAFSVLMIMGMVLSYGQLLNLPLPNPVEIVETIFTPVTAYLDNLLG
jgi:hypothetical protein